MVGEENERREAPEGWEYTRSGIQALDVEMKQFEDALFRTWTGRTKSRGSNALDGPDCREASRFLLVGTPAPRWKVVLRIFSSVSLIFLAIPIVKAFEENRSNTDMILILLAGIIGIIAVLALQETVLKR